MATRLPIRAVRAHGDSYAHRYLDECFRGSVLARFATECVGMLMAWTGSRIVRVGGALTGHPPRDLRTGGEVELGEDVLHVSLDRALRDHQVLGDLLVRLALCDELGDLPFPLGHGHRVHVVRTLPG